MAYLSNGSISWKVALNPVEMPFAELSVVNVNVMFSEVEK